MKRRTTHHLTPPAQGQGSAGAAPPCQNLAERAYRRLEDEIVRLRLAPGMLITEQDLAGRLAIGRTPVREAIQRLVADRLLVVFPRKGVMIASINPFDVLLALDVRTVLERLVIAAATDKADPAERARLQAVVDQLSAAAKAGAVDRYMRCDKEFDRLVAMAAANPFAESALAPLQTMSRRAWFYFCRNHDLAPAADRHADLMHAMAAGNRDRAAAASDALIAHIRNGLKRALALL